jgi:hypothetical protein
MIQLDKVQDKDKYAFPTIDFKFQNTGETAAVLWQFAIEVLEAEVDTSPDLKFYCEVDRLERGGALRIFAKNSGWGAAYECEGILEEPVLEHFFTKDQRTFVGNIESGRNKQIFHLLPNIDPQRFADFHKRAMEEARKEMEQHLSELFGPDVDINDYDSVIPVNRHGGYRESERERFTRKWIMSSAGRPNILSVPLGFLILKLRYKDARNRIVTSNASAGGQGFAYELFITPDGFVGIEHYISACKMPSGITYCTILNPSLGSHERTYPISRMIPPGDVERFHIMVGASKSCSLRLRFKFSVDKSKVVTSEEFNIQISNPVGSGFSDEYRDGEELERRGAEIGNKVAPDYPFTNQNKQNSDQWIDRF